MAKIVGIGTGISGKVGNVQYKTVKGMQLLQTKSTPKLSRTPEQLSNRSIFSQLNSIFKPLSGSLIKDYWNPFVIGKRSGWSEILSFNLKLQDSPIFDISKLQVSRGSLPGEICTSAKYNSKLGACQVSWITSHPAGSNLSDRSHCFYYDISTFKWYSSISPSIRSSNLIWFSISPGLDLLNLRCFLFFSTGIISTASKKSVSISSYRIVTR